jgi:hypothetical protein
MSKLTNKIRSGRLTDARSSTETPLESSLSFLGRPTGRFWAVWICAKPKAARSAAFTAASRCLRPDPRGRPTGLRTFGFS